ncbi:MAG TPA: hypothetical protein VMT66_16865 [Steroidobacteraceae bacterium]|nr:hypothetical protein [Steroidobacteraceae bacterium]
MMQFCTTLRNAQLDLIAGMLGYDAQLRFYDGALPANCAAAAVGELLATIALPARPFARAFDGKLEKNGAWMGVVIAAGHARYWRLARRDGMTVIQGPAGMLFEGTEPLFELGATVHLETFRLTAGNE